MLDSSLSSVDVSLYETQKKQQPIQILIHQAYSTYNKGEVAIAISLIETIKRIYPAAKISIMTPDPTHAQTQYSNYGVKSYPRLLHISRENKGIRKIMSFSKLILQALLYLILINLSNVRVDKSSRIAFDLLRNADVVIIAGGGTFGGAKYRSFPSNLFPIYLAKKLGKKVMVYGPSVEPFTSKVVKAMTRHVLNSADIITVREQLSFDLLQSLHLKNLHRTADPAFLIGNESLDTGLLLLKEGGVPVEKRLLVGMTIKDWDFPNEQNSYQKRLNYLTAIRETMEKLLAARDDALIVVFSTSLATQASDDDRVISMQVKSLVKHDLRDRVIVLTMDYAPQQLKAMMGNTDVFISTRFHSAVFALSMNIPVVMIATEPNKNRGLMDMLDLADYTIDAGSATSEKLLTTVLRLIDERELVAQEIKNKLPLIKDQSMKNEKHLESLLTS